MKKIMKAAGVTILSVCMFVFAIVPISADNNEYANGKTYYTNYTDEDLRKMNEELVREQYESNTISTRMSTGYDYESVYKSHDFSELKHVGPATGQPDGGFHFGSGGGSILYTDSTTSAIKSLSFSFSIYGYVSIGVGLGKATKGGVTGVSFNAPPNEYSKLYISKTFKRTEYSNYRVNRITGYREYLGTSFLNTQYSFRGDVR